MSTETTTPIDSRSAITRSPSIIADPIPIATGILALQLLLYVVRWIDVSPKTLAESPIGAAVNVSILIAAIAQIGSGLLSLLRGSAYVGYVASIFGIWLIGFYMLAIQHEVDPLAISWYLLSVVIPLALLMVPAVMRRRYAFIVAFGAIIVFVILDAIAFRMVHNSLSSEPAKLDFSTPITLLHVSSYFAIATIVSLFWLCFRGILEGARIVPPANHFD